MLKSYDESQNMSANKIRRLHKKGQSCTGDAADDVTAAIFTTLLYPHEMQLEHILLLSGLRRAWRSSVSLRASGLLGFIVFGVPHLPYSSLQQQEYEFEMHSEI